MRLILQRVKSANVKVTNKTVGKISHGFLLLIGVSKNDEEKDADKLIEKVLKLRLFPDSDLSNSFMGKNVQEVSGSILVVSQFTLFAEFNKGTKPSFSEAAEPEKAKELYNYFIDRLRSRGVKVETGVFAAHMEVELINDGPITLVLES